MLRRDAKKLGRVQEIFLADKILKESRKAFDLDGGDGISGGVAGLTGAAGVEKDGVEGEGKKRGRKRKKVEEN